MTSSSATPAPPAALSPDPAARTWPHRHLLGLQALGADDLRLILHTVRSFADVSNRSVKKVPALRGKVVANLFFEDSTRTRLSFTLAAQRLSADVIDLTASASSVNKGETIADTALNVLSMGVDAFCVRHKASGAAALVARAVGDRCAVINAGDGRHEHPTQGLLDIYTLAEAHHRLDTFDLTGLRVAIVGDVVSSRVARSNIAGLTALGAHVVCVGPPTLVPRSLQSLGCSIDHDFDRVIPGVDAVNMLRVQFERHGSADPGKEGNAQPGIARASPAFPSVREYVQGYALTEDRAARLRPARSPSEPGAIVMHPGPMNRGVEIAGSVADGPKSVILRQVANGLAVRMAALYLCVGAGAEA
ncbi:MAG: aspartate carbamoyltransferase catalytic subunit [Phycisphaerales bacterium]